MLFRNVILIKFEIVAKAGLRLLLSKQPKANIPFKIMNGMYCYLTFILERYLHKITLLIFLPFYLYFLFLYIRNTNKVSLP